MKRKILGWLCFVAIALLVWIAAPASSDEAGDSKQVVAEAKEQRTWKEMLPEGQRERSTHLLDRGGTAKRKTFEKGGGGTGPFAVFHPMGSPAAVASPFPVGFFPPGSPATPLSLAVGNMFIAGAGFPTGWITMGTSMGFFLTGAYAWHWPLNPVAGAPGGSMTRFLMAAPVLPSGTPFAPTVMIPGLAVTTTGAFGPPGPTGVVSVTMAFSVPVATIGPTSPPFSGAWCGMVVGNGAYWAPATPSAFGNGLGANLPAGPPGFPIRGGTPGTLSAGVLPAILAPPANYIAGCYADGASIPVELQSFHIE